MCFSGPLFPPMKLNSFLVINACDGVAYRCEKTLKGYPKLLGGGYGFIIKNHNGGKTYWQCDHQRKTGCPARLVMDQNSLTPRGLHNHPRDNNKF